MTPLTLPAKSGTGDFKILPAGTHFAICDIIADCGMQPGSRMYPNPKRKLYIRFEVPAEVIEYTDKDGKQVTGSAVIGSFYTASMHENSALRPLIEGWRGRSFTDEEAEQFDISKVLGKPCMLNVVHNKVEEKTYANIASISPLPKGMEAPKATTKQIFYTKEDWQDFDLLPEWLRVKIDAQLAPELPQTATVNQHGVAIQDDDIPF